jgi:putative ABC transport system ATP-binding protein
LERGQKVFLMGPSGCGKTTLLSLIGGVVVPQNGEVRILGKIVNKLPSSSRDRFRADHVGYIFQLFNLISYLSVLDNVLLPLSFSYERRRRLREKSVDPSEEAKRLLEGLGIDVKTYGSRSISQLSVGQQQRVAAARALLGDPEIIIADEPTSALDADNRSAFINLLSEECSRHGSTLLFVSHDRSLASHFDQQLSLSTLNRAVAL